jgi:hypothetical protein
MYCLRAAKINSSCLVFYVEVSEGSEQVQQIETTAPAMSVHVLLGAGQGLGAYSEMKSATSWRKQSSVELSTPQKWSAIQPCPIVGVKTHFIRDVSVGVMAQPSSLADYCRFARHPPTIQKLI